MKFAECFGGVKRGDGDWQFQLDETINGAFGGTTGGVLAALTVHAARDFAPGWRVTGIDARFIRSFRPGVASVVGTPVNEGRTLTTVQVDLNNAEGKLCTRALVSLVNPDSLEAIDYQGIEVPAGLLAPAEGKPWAQPKPPLRIPLLDTFAPVFLGKTGSGTVTGVKTIWNSDEHCAEAVCIAADISVGPPVMSALKGQRVATPNPDISLRFCTETDLPPLLLANCRLESLVAGLASTRIEVWANDTLLAIGVSSTTCIGNR
jgi:acyl-coenzyme A thioesterase PaaI-like protein